MANDSTGGDAGAGNAAGAVAAGGTGGSETIGEGGSGGVADEQAGSSGEAGAGGAGATSGSGGSGGTGGAPASCTGGCDDANDCTTDSCVSGECAHEALTVGTSCGIARTCDAKAQCVRCRDTAAGTDRDAGCTPAAPICLGTGLDAACAGCTTAADCSDNNDCTSEACSDGKCVFATITAGTACATGVCNGTASAEKCVSCADTAAGALQDAGCSAAKPVCDPSGTATCYECVGDTDCASDNVSCTVETCTNHQCSRVATDSLCPATGDVCIANKCDPSVTGGCKKVDISASKLVLGTSSTQGNGGFEAGTTNGAVGWANIGNYVTVYNCPTATQGCGADGKTGTSTTGGDFLAWLGGTSMATVTGVDHLIVLPAGTVKLQVIADINFQTKNSAPTNRDYFEVRLLNSAKTQVGAALYAASNTNAQTGGTRSWTLNGINVTVDVSTYATAHPGEDSYISFWSSVDGSAITDFFFDNVRVNATVCQ